MDRVKEATLELEIEWSLTGDMDCLVCGGKTKVEYHRVVCYDCGSVLEVAK
jgi:hypothetical protein